MTRIAALLAPLSTALAMLLGSPWAQAAPGEANARVELTRHGASLELTHTLHNPGVSSIRVEIPISLPCEVAISQLEVREPDVDGAAHWRSAIILDPSDADLRWSAALLGPPAGVVSQLDADTSVLLTRDESCDATLELYPVPPLGRRSLRYSLFIPSHYEEGEHRIEIPDLSTAGGIPMLHIDDPGSEIEAAVDGTALRSTISVAGDRPHQVVVRDRDRRAGHVDAADLQLSTSARVQTADFAAPSLLADVPSPRRVVVILDRSRSLQGRAPLLREAAQGYLEALAREHSETRVEISTFDRDVHPVYQGFVPAEWAAEDLPKLQLETRNGSDLAAAVDAAIAMLAAGSPAGPGVDWIVVFSDLDLQASFDLEQDVADHLSRVGNLRVHVVSAGSTSFGPAPSSDPWARFALAEGGMAWQIGDDLAASDLGEELIRPRRVWDLELIVEDDHQITRVPLVDQLLAGSSYHWDTLADLEPQPLARVGFHGQVWGQERAWFGVVTLASNQRNAARLATDDFTDELADEARAHLARFSQVVSPWTSAWAVARFDGAAAIPQVVATPMATGFGSAYGSSHCGGGFSTHCSAGFHRPETRALVETVIATCDAASGVLVFETTGPEVVRVETPNPCVTAGMWDIDLRGTGAGFATFELRFTQGHIDRYQAIR